VEQEAWLEVVLAMAVLAVALAAGVLLLARPKLQHRCRPWCLRETWDEVEAVLVEVQVAVAAVAAAQRPTGPPPPPAQPLRVASGTHGGGGDADSAPRHRGTYARSRGSPWRTPCACTRRAAADACMSAARCWSSCTHRGARRPLGRSWWRRMWRSSCSRSSWRGCWGGEWATVSYIQSVREEASFVQHSIRLGAATRLGVWSCAS